MSLHASSLRIRFSLSMFSSLSGSARRTPSACAASLTLDSMCVTSSLLLYLSLWLASALCIARLVSSPRARFFDRIFCETHQSVGDPQSLFRGSPLHGRRDGVGEPMRRLLVLPSFSFRLTLPSTHFFTSRIYFSFLSSLLSSLPRPPIASIPRRLFPSFPSFHSPSSLLPKIITDVGLALFHLGIVFSLFTFLFTFSSASSSESDPLLYIYNTVTRPFHTLL